MSEQDKSYDRLIDSSAESAALMSSVVRDLDQLVASDELKSSPRVRSELGAVRDQLDVGSIALYTEIESITVKNHAGDEVDGSRAGLNGDRPALTVVPGGLGQVGEPVSLSSLDDFINPVNEGNVDESYGEMDASLPPLPEPTVRRSIVVPDEIANDSVAVARFVVSTPNSVLLVDGDAVASLGWPTFPVNQKRGALITYLTELSENSGCSPDVVLDGRLGDEGTRHASTAVRIRLTKSPTAPVQSLDELVDAYPAKWSVVVVTDDPVLTSSVADRNAFVLDNRQLLDLFMPT